MRNIILSQRKERDELASRNYIARETKYCKEEILNSSLIKLITGPRRVGKSVYALPLLNGENFAYLNFDDKLLLDNWDEERVMLALEDVYPEHKFLLLDEVQNLKAWDLWVSKLFRRGVNMVITGSNAKMLSSEMATVLTGRYIQIEMLPFSLEETLCWYGIDTETTSEKEMKTDEYIHEGGFPETLASRSIARNYLGSLFDSVLLKDVAQRHRIRNTSDIYNLAQYLLTNFCNPFTYNDLAESLGLASVATVKKFCDYLHEPYLFFYLSQYNNKLKEMKKAAKKVYVVDNGFVQSSAFSLSENLGRLLENLVFVELLRHGYNTEKSLFYYRSRNNKETDFVIRQDTTVIKLIQACYDMQLPKTRKREVNSLIECAEELKCKNLLIVTRSQEEMIEQDGYTIKVVPIGKFADSL